MKTNYRKTIEATILTPFLALGLLASRATAQVNYEVYGITARVTSSPNASGNIVIDSTYNGFPVTAIQQSAFRYCTGLTGVTIPNSVTNIGSSAFFNCISLADITIPNSITVIGDNAFEDCASLMNVTIPDGVITLGRYAFEDCTNLTSVMISDSVASIGSSAFENCRRLTNIAVAAANSTYSSLDGVLFNKAQTTLIEFPGGRGGSYAIPNGVTRIGDSAFEYCGGLASVTGGNNLTNIGFRAFIYCTNLASVPIPNGVTAIGFSAFYGCKSLTSMVIPDAVTNIGFTAFFGCRGLTNIAVGAANPAYAGPNGVLFNKAQTILIQFPGARGGSYVIPNGVTALEHYAFYNCTSLKSVTMPNTLTYVGVQDFYYCTSLTNVTMGTGLTIIDVGAFGGCASFKSVTIPNNVTYLGDRAFADCTGLTNVTMGNGVTNVGSSAFSGCTSLRSVTLGAGIINFASSAFSGCTSLSSVTLGAGVTSVGDAFSYCTALTNFSVNAANSVYSSLNGVLFNKAQTILIQFPPGRAGGYVIPNSVTNIGPTAFSGCTRLTSVTFPNNVTSIAIYEFYSCTSLTNFTVNAANSVYSSLNGVLFNKAQTTLVRFPTGRGGSYVIPNGVTTVGNSAFYNCLGLTSAMIPNTVATIQGSAFGACPSLTNVTMGNSITDIGEYAFSYCTSLTNVTFAGNAPPLVDINAFASVGPAANVYYYYGTTGWGPTYGGLPTVMLGAPAPQIGTGSAGVRPGGYGFTVSGVTNQTIVVEVSTNLVNWQPVWTNTLSGASTNFVDSQWLNHPHRFYRVVQP